MLQFDKHMGKFFQALLSLFKDEEKVTAFKESLPLWEAHVARLSEKTGWLSGHEEPMYIDVHFFPMLERLVMLENSPWNYAFEDLKIKENCSTIYTFVHKLRGHPVLK